MKRTQQEEDPVDGEEAAMALDVADGTRAGDPFRPLLKEHASLRRLLAEMATSPGSRERFLGLLRRHMDREERILYPLCEKLFDGEGGPVDVLRQDHASLEGLAQALETAGDEAAASGEALRAMGCLLGAHIQREEGVLFPFLECLLSQEEARRLGLHLEAENRH